jgi:hypothetical protein
MLFDSIFYIDHFDDCVGMFYKIITPLICKYSYYKTTRQLLEDEHNQVKIVSLCDRAME